MPVGAIKGPESEKNWNRAKAAATKQYPGLESENKDKFYAIVMTIYKSMCKNKSCSPKAESMSGLIGRLNSLVEGEELDEAVTLTGVVMALDRALTRARALVPKLTGKYVGDQRKEVKDQLEKYAKELLSISKGIQG